MYTELLQHIQQYTPLNKTEEQAIVQHFKVLQLKKKTLILKPGEICKGNYFVAKGCLRMYFFDDKGVEQTTQFAIEGRVPLAVALTTSNRARSRSREGSAGCSKNVA